MPDPHVYTEHAVDVLGHAVDLLDAGRRCVLITSIDIKGGAAREVGSLAVVCESGSMIGYMSNGCIDRDIRLQALALLESDDPAKTLRYGEGSPFFDLKLPCGGSLELLLDARPDPEALHDAHSALLERSATRMDFALPGGNGLASFLYSPKSRLAIAGRGAVFRATVQVAEAAGFETLAYSPDEADLEAVRHVSSLDPAFISNPLAQLALPLDSFSGFLTLFHDHDWEPELLKAALMTDARFIGCLGSRKTHQMRLANLQADGVDTQSLSRLKGPIGLVPSLRNAPSIAVSALAQVIEAFPSSIYCTSGERQGRAA
ncbi:XdhC family protein [Shimia sp. CNT1-13L.2]|uniref:XdhC family protein n=1 Tax=Shimia sp. CNT1-13L.2 TaxID=2959663 RepID=UPI0020CD6E90|nr:XdhC family protein [Shimia sp. CNT1-13L.2]MCP9483868.1 XdhC family protein [Shimia sp. CNT1-13L.2]